jgi:H+/gluconate symporter-like permease
MTLEVTWAGFLLGLCLGLFVAFVAFVWFGVRLAKRTKNLQDTIRDAALRDLGEKN